MNGTWEIEESVEADRIPERFGHKIPVPGLVHLAEPGFPDAGRYDSPQKLPRKPGGGFASVGVSHQTRNYFWYRIQFQAPRVRDTAILKIGKAQFGTAVWLNGKKIGEYSGCFTAGFFNLSAAMDWKGQNTLLVRVGAHPAALPATVPTGTDPSRALWLPGIYDEVSLILTESALIESVQVAPRIQTSEIEIQAVLKNYGGPRSVTLRHYVGTGGAVSDRISLAAGEQKMVRRRLPMPKAVLWSPENPHLYSLVTSAGADDVTTRFGMREVRFDTATKRAYLNGKPYFFRGSNICLHRFFEDPKCRRLPWTKDWVRKALVDIPKRLHWNSVRFHVGPMPDFWIDMADEAGIIIFNEFFIFQHHEQWSTAELTAQFKDWMRDQWNHASIVLWDASNETRWDELGKIIQAVRGDDLSGRAWDNGYNLPVGPDDPVEDHRYPIHRLGKGFEFTDLENMTGAKETNSPHPTGHAAILNEYEWIWLQRDGTPTRGTQSVWSRLLPNGSPAERIALRAYLSGGLTEYYRAHRNYAGVMHFAYLSYSVPYSNSSDCFTDIERLELEPQFESYIGEAFKPLGVYINFWRPTLPAGASQTFAVMMLNDKYEEVRGKLVLSIKPEEAAEPVRRELPFHLPGLGQQTYQLSLEIPNTPGKALLKAEAFGNTGGSTPTVSRREFSIVR